MEGVLGDFDAADGLHALFALLLLLEELALSRDVAAVALGGDVFAEGTDGFSGDDLGADRRLNRDFVLLLRDDLLQLRSEGAAEVVRLVFVNDGA